MSKKYYLFEAVSLVSLVGAAIFIDNHHPLPAFAFIGLYGFVNFKQGQIEVKDHLQRYVDKMVWVKVKKAAEKQEKAL